ncbi:MAG: hypothetical protein OHK93_007434 [Ramalina farinacea]|uniref:D-isomer specific 2-hydroxyacid dehydrogenase NAD-binding domain-containing protein n=1 Tax=Ramalina farinacea TaxID=258253 RepID=A0AA43TVI4_9LECA|nr:hypothetical protein [Ramalina farinacea]
MENFSRSIPSSIEVIPTLNSSHEKEWPSIPSTSIIQSLNIATDRLKSLASTLLPQNIAMGGGDGSSPPAHVLIILPIPEPTDAIARIKRKHPTIEITFRSLLFNPTSWQGRGQPIDPSIYSTITHLVTLSALPPSPSDAPHLQLILLASAGSNHIQHTPIYKDTDITLTTSSGIHGPQIAEWCLMTALASSHYYNMLHDWQKQHKWGRSGVGESDTRLETLRDKVGQRLGVLGYGSIGRQVARVAKAMGMRVIVYTASPRPTPESKRDAGFIVPGTGDPDGSIPEEWFSGLDKESLHHFLGQGIDWLIISVPLTKQTTKLISAPELSILGKTRNSFVTNISRGQILDQTALVKSLRAYAAADPVKGGDGGGGVRGAALDVTDPEPLPETDELWAAPNCIITPHVSGLGVKYMDRVLQVFEVNLEREEEGASLINVVDRKRGY